MDGWIKESINETLSNRKKNQSTEFRLKKITKETYTKKKQLNFDGDLISLIFQTPVKI